LPCLVAIALASTLLQAPASAQEPEVPTAETVHASPPPPEVPLAEGKASWYGPRFHGRRTSSGERFDMHDLTAAHTSLPFGTRVRVRNVANGREVVVRINDRGPHVRQRIIDLSRAAASALGILKTGEAPVVVLPH
jgi:rare lipoprotein A